MINELIKLANTLDESGFKKEADRVDAIIKQSQVEPTAQGGIRISLIELQGEIIRLINRWYLEWNKMLRQQDPKLVQRDAQAGIESLKRHLLPKLSELNRKASAKEFIHIIKNIRLLLNMNTKNMVSPAMYSTTVAPIIADIVGQGVWVRAGGAAAAQAVAEVGKLTGGAVAEIIGWAGYTGGQAAAAVAKGGLLGIAAGLVLWTGYEGIVAAMTWDEAKKDGTNKELDTATLAGLNRAAKRLGENDSGFWKRYSKRWVGETKLQIAEDLNMLSVEDWQYAIDQVAPEQGGAFSEWNLGLLEGVGDYWRDRLNPDGVTPTPASKKTAPREGGGKIFDYGFVMKTLKAAKEKAANLTEEDVEEWYTEPEPQEKPTRLRFMTDPGYENYPDDNA